MAENQLPDINAYINALPVDKAKKDRLSSAFYSDRPREEFESIQDVPLSVRQTLFGIRGKIYNGESYDLNDIVRAGQAMGKAAAPQVDKATAPPPSMAPPQPKPYAPQMEEVGLVDTLRRATSDAISSVFGGSKTKTPAPAKTQEAKDTQGAKGKTEDKGFKFSDYSLGGNIAKNHPDWFVPISKKIDPSSLTATETYEAWKDLGASLMAEGLGVPKSKIETDVSNIVGAKFLDEAAKTIPELFDFMSSPGGLGYLAAGLTAGKVKAVAPIFKAIISTDLGAAFSDEMKAAVSDPTERNIAKAAKSLGFLVLGVKDQLMPKPGEAPQPGGSPKVTVDFGAKQLEAPKPEAKLPEVTTKQLEPPKVEAKTAPVSEVKSAEAAQIKTAEPAESPVAEALPAAATTEPPPSIEPSKQPKQTAPPPSIPAAAPAEPLAAKPTEPSATIKTVKEEPVEPQSKEEKKDALADSQPSSSISPTEQNIHPKPDPAGETVVISSPDTPTPDATWKDPTATAIFVPNGKSPAKIGKTELKPWSPPDDGWSSVGGTNERIEADNPFVPDPNKASSSGVIIMEDDGRVWVASPTNQFGGYDNTLPKGQVEEGLTLQQNAIKEAWEETGIKADIIGILGDYDKSTSKTRYYLGIRTGGTPTDMGWESQAVKLATPEDAKKILNQKIDKRIIDDLQKMVSSGKLAEIKDGIPRKLSSYGPMVEDKTSGSNPGGWYQDENTKWLVKGNKQKVLNNVTPEQSDARAVNEVLASKLMQAVSKEAAPDMKLVDLEGEHGGGLGVASKKVQSFYNFDKNNPDHAKAAIKNFATNAWLANYDVLGMGYDNTVITPNGGAVNIDPGGALLFRAQGLPKGELHGVVNGLLDPSAPEFESMQKTTPEQKKIFGSMTQAQIKESAELLAKVTDEKIRKIVQTYGQGTNADKTALADNLIARKNSILQKAGIGQNSAVASVAQAPAGNLVSPQAKTQKAAQLGTIKYKNGTLDAPQDVAARFKLLSSYWKAKVVQEIDSIASELDSAIVNNADTTSLNAVLDKKFNSYNTLASKQMSETAKSAYDKVLTPFLAHIQEKLNDTPLPELKDSLSKFTNPATAQQKASQKNTVVSQSAKVPPPSVPVINTGSGSFVIPQSFINIFETMNAENQASFGKRVNDIVSAINGGQSIEKITESLEYQKSQAEAKAASYSKKVSSGNANSFEIERAKYYNDLYVPYLDFVISTKTLPSEPPPSFTSPTGASLSIPKSTGVPSKPDWAGNINKGAPSFKIGSPQKVADNLAALAFTSAIYGENSNIAKSFLKMAKRQLSADPKGNSLIQDAISDGVAKFSTFKDVYKDVPEEWAWKLAESLSKPDQFKFPFPKSSSLFNPFTCDDLLFDDFGKHQENEIVNKLSPNQVSSLQSYAGSLYKSLNNAVAKAYIYDQPLPLAVIKHTERLDDAFSKVNLGYDLKLKRTVPAEYFWKQLGYKQGKYPTDPATVKDLIGQQYAEITYAGTSMRPDWEATFAGSKTNAKVIFTINASKDFNGIKIHGKPIQGPSSEYEVLLPRGTTYVITDFKFRGNTWGAPVWEADVTIVDQTAKPLKKMTTPAP